MTNKYSQIVETAVNADGAVDASVVQKGGFTKVPARAGVALFRLRSYIETGMHVVKKGKGKGKKQMWADFTFELVHPDHLIGPDDKKFPDTISLNNINISMNEKAKYFKLFKKMNHTGTKTSFSQMLGDGFLGRVVHNVSGDTTYVNMEEDGQYLIGAPRYEADPIGNPGVVTEVNVPELDGDVQLFLFDAPGVQPDQVQMMWDDLEITGEKSDGTAKKNWIQEKIRSAINFEGSFTQQVVGGAAIAAEEVADDVADAVAAATNTATDPLANTTAVGDAPFVADATPEQSVDNLVAAANATVVDPLAGLTGL